MPVCGSTEAVLGNCESWVGVNKRMPAQLDNATSHQLTDRCARFIPQTHRGARRQIWLCLTSSGSSCLARVQRHWPAPAHNSITPLTHALFLVSYRPIPRSASSHTRQGRPVPSADYHPRPPQEGAGRESVSCAVAGVSAPCVCEHLHRTGGAARLCAGSKAN